MKNIIIILSLCGGFAAHATLTEGEQTDKNKYDFFSLRSVTQKYQAGKASLAEVKAALAELKKDGFKGITDPATLTADQAKGMTVTAENTCGYVLVIGPNGSPVTGMRYDYSSAAGKVAAIATAQNHCVAGFRPVAIDSTK